MAWIINCQQEDYCCCQEEDHCHQEEDCCHQEEDQRWNYQNQMTNVMKSKMIGFPMMPLSSSTTMPSTMMSYSPTPTTMAHGNAMFNDMPMMTNTDGTIMLTTTTNTNVTMMLMTMPTTMPTTNTNLTMMPTMPPFVPMPVEDSSTLTPAGNEQAGETNKEEKKANNDNQKQESV